MANLSTADAQKALAAALGKAAELGSPSSVAVLDSGRELLAFTRMDGALLASIEISQNKAYTSASMKMATGDLTDVHNYTIAATEASLQTEMTVAVRDRAVAAFNQIMAMQV